MHYADVPFPFFSSFFVSYFSLLIASSVARQSEAFGSRATTREAAEAVVAMAVAMAARSSDNENNDNTKYISHSFHFWTYVAKGLFAQHTHVYGPFFAI